MSPAALQCLDVAVRHEPGAPAVLHNLSFEVAIGERVALVGLNGAGKTSLLLTLMGLAPHDGEIRICGDRLSRRTAPALRRRIGFLGNVPEDQLLFPTALEDVAFGLVRDGLDAMTAQERARASLHALGVEHVANHPLHHLSHGQKLRVALAGVLFAAPDLLLLDEPTNYLDLEGTLWLESYLAKYPHTVIVISHDRQLLNRSVGAILHLDQRKLTLYQGNYDAFARQRPVKGYVQVLQIVVWIGDIGVPLAAGSVGTAHGRCSTPSAFTGLDDARRDNTCRFFLSHVRACIHYLASCCCC
mgnify:CR=1 FL=1